MKSIDEGMSILTDLSADGSARKRRQRSGRERLKELAVGLKEFAAPGRDGARTEGLTTLLRTFDPTTRNRFVKHSQPCESQHPSCVKPPIDPAKFQIFPGMHLAHSKDRRKPWIIRAGKHVDQLNKRRGQVSMTLQYIRKERNEAEENTDWLDRATYETRIALLDRLSEWYVTRDRSDRQSTRSA